MHRIDTKTAQKDKFGAGKNGFNEAYAISVNRHSTDVIVTWNARKADDVHILGIGKL